MINLYLKQVSGLNTRKPYLLKIKIGKNKKWMIIRDLRDVERALKLRDKKGGMKDDTKDHRENHA
jgi:hypothetical protein